LTGYLCDHLPAREPELERLGPVRLWQVEQDLELLERYALAGATGIVAEVRRRMGGRP
jgi:hypothetical protein